MRFFFYAPAIRFIPVIPAIHQQVAAVVQVAWSLPVPAAAVQSALLQALQELQDLQKLPVFQRKVLPPIQKAVLRAGPAQALLLAAVQVAAPVVWAVARGPDSATSQYLR